MNNSRQDPTIITESVSAVELKRKSSRFPPLLLGVISMGSVLAYLALDGADKPPSPPAGVATDNQANPVGMQTPAPKTTFGDNPWWQTPSEQQELPSLVDSGFKDARIVSQPGSPSAGQVYGSTPASGRSPEVFSWEQVVAMGADGTEGAWGLLTEVANRLDYGAGTITVEDADEINRMLKQLTEIGPAALPAIRDYLQRTAYMGADKLLPENRADDLAVRLALLDAVYQIGGDQAVGISLELLQTTAEPLEIINLARTLEAGAPGQYRQDILNAAREVFAMASQRDLGRRQAAAVFEVFQEYGDGHMASELQQMPLDWTYHSTIALAGMAEGEGISALIRMVEDPEAVPFKVQSQFALEMVAQVAARYPDAQAVLIEKARANEIPDNLWPDLARLIAGVSELYQRPFGKPIGGDSGGEGSQTELFSYNRNRLLRSGGGQIVRRSAHVTSDQVDQRLALIDQLLAKTSNTTAVQALRDARALLR